MDSLTTWDLLITSATPVVQLALLASVGALLAHKGTLNHDGCQVLARLCFYVFTPALTFSKLAQAISVESVKHLWPLLANMAISIVVGLCIGLMMATLLRTPHQFKPHALAAIAFGNVGNLPLVFVRPLCHDRRAVFYRALGDSCEQVGIAYIAFNISVATIFQFGIAINLFRPRTRGQGSQEELEGDIPDTSDDIIITQQPSIAPLLPAFPRAGLGHTQLSKNALQQPQHAQQAASPAAPWPRATLEMQAVHGEGPGRTEPPSIGRSSPTQSAAITPQAAAGPGASAGAHGRQGLRLKEQGRYLGNQGGGDVPLKGRDQMVLWGSRPDLLSLAGRQRAQQAQQACEQQQQQGAEGSGGEGTDDGDGGVDGEEREGEGEDALQSDSTWLLGAAHHRHAQRSDGDRHAAATTTLVAGAPSLPQHHSASQQHQQHQHLGGLQYEGYPGNAAPPHVRTLQRMAGLWRSARGVDWAAVIPLPTQASILGVVVGCIPPLKAALYGADPPLGSLSDVLNTLGNGLVPTTIPLLGAVLYRGPGESALPWRVTLGVLLTRLVLQPVLLTGVVILCLRAGLYSSPDPMFLMILLLANTTPTAVNMQTITVLYKNGAAEMSTILFWQYLASLVTLPAFMWWFLKIIEVWHPEVAAMQEQP